MLDVQHWLRELIAQRKWYFETNILLLLACQVLSFDFKLRLLPYFFNFCWFNYSCFLYPKIHYNIMRIMHFICTYAHMLYKQYCGIANAHIKVVCLELNEP